METDTEREREPRFLFAIPSTSVFTLTVGKQNIIKKKHHRPKTLKSNLGSIGIIFFTDPKICERIEKSDGKKRVRTEATE